jgi:hypothetical protein
MKKSLLLLILLAVILTACTTFTPETQELTWEPVSSPSDFAGACWGYFITEGILDQQHSFSSVECVNGGPHVNVEVRELDWKQLLAPPGRKGPCYGYFITKGILDQQHSFSGSWCEE